MQAHFLLLVFLLEYTNMAHSSGDQLGRRTNKSDTALVYHNKLIAH